ncbi:MAG: 1,2-phenylacetyl-CoA epoxidase subunit PaaD [Gammaproteobacteria bacterium]
MTGSAPDLQDVFDATRPRVSAASLHWDGTQAGLWQVLAQISDPEIPVISIVDLGIVREVALHGDAVTVTVTPTYAGCPATDAIRQDIVHALQAVGLATVQVHTRLSPAWTTDWIALPAREALRAYGIAPPCAVAAADTPRPLRFQPRCPRCHSPRTALLAPFGATPCKALYRCEACREPFDYFKPL